MPCERCGLSNVSGVCNECRLLDRMEADLDAGAYPGGEARDGGEE